MPEEQKRLLPPHEAENARENIWIYRAYQGLTRKGLAKGKLKPGLIRAYEYGFVAIPPHHLEIIARKLNMTVEQLTAPPDYSLLLNWQTRRMVEYYRRLNDQKRYVIKLLMMRLVG
jgi:hypothetical protein